MKPLPDIDPAVGKEIRERDWTDTRNVVDKYKGVSTEDITRDLASSSCGLVALLNNSIRDFNWSTVVRNANGFNIKRVEFCGRRNYDKRGTVGAHHYMDIGHRDSILDAISYWRGRGYHIVAAEYVEERPMTSLYGYRWEKDSVIVFGEEGVTLPDEILNDVDDIVYIPMHGSVRSFNVGVASGIFMNSYRSQFAS